MVYFNSRDVAVIAICSALWGILNSVLSPIFFQFTGMPFLCDLIGFSILSVAAWWTRKFGIITFIGLVATGINFIINPGGIHFLGFTFAAIVFDLILLFGYNLQVKGKSMIIMFTGFASVLSAGVAGYIIGIFFIPTVVLVSRGGVLVWVGLHAFGGLVGGVIGIVIICALKSRSVLSKNVLK